MPDLMTVEDKTRDVTTTETLMGIDHVFEIASKEGEGFLSSEVVFFDEYRLSMPVFIGLVIFLWWKRKEISKTLGKIF